MSEINFDELLSTYKQATDQWVDAIRKEEGFATSNHSMTEWEQWDGAGLAVHDAEAGAKKAHDAYKNALRRKNYGF